MEEYLISHDKSYIFIHTFKNIVSQLPNYNIFQISLYLDNLQIYYCLPDMKIVKGKLQKNMNIVEKLTQKSGFNLYISKIFLIQFY